MNPQFQPSFLDRMRRVSNRELAAGAAIEAMIVTEQQSDPQQAISRP